MLARKIEEITNATLVFSVTSVILVSALLYLGLSSIESGIVTTTGEKTPC